MEEPIKWVEWPIPLSDRNPLTIQTKHQILLTNLIAIKGLGLGAYSFFTSGDLTVLYKKLLEVHDLPYESEDPCEKRQLNTTCIHFSNELSWNRVLGPRLKREDVPESKAVGLYFFPSYVTWDNYYTLIRASHKASVKTCADSTGRDSLGLVSLDQVKLWLNPDMSSVISEILLRDIHELLGIEEHC